MTVGGGLRKTQEDKKAQILRIALEEFARCGYSGASTNTITTRAGISKGILFHYFGSKKELFLLLLSGVTKRLGDLSSAAPAESEGASLVDAMAALFMSKAAYFQSYPLDMAFLERARQEQSADVRQEIVKELSGLAATMRSLRTEMARRAVDAAVLRGGVTKAQALECILLSLEALDSHFYAMYRGRGAEVMTNPEPILATMRLFLDVVSRGLFDNPIFI